MEPTKDDEVKPTKGGEGEPTKGGEVEPTNDGEMEPTNDGEVEREARMAVATEVEFTRESDAEEIIIEAIEEEEEPNPDGIVEAEEGVDLEVCAFGGLAIGSPPGLPSHRKPSYSNWILYKP